MGIALKDKPPEQTPIPDWHIDALDRREEIWRNSPDPGIDWETAKSRILNRT